MKRCVSLFAILFLAFSSLITQGQLTATIAGQTDVTCNGFSDGTIDLSASGGSTPYDFLWSNSATTEDLSGLGPGLYTVTVTDNALATATASATISEPDLLVATAGTLSDVTCFGGSDGSADVTVTGGTAGFSYAWSNGGNTQVITGLIAGTYSVTVSDANSCTATSSTTVTEPPTAVTAIASVNQDVSCFGGSDGEVTVTEGGGTPGYSYYWSTTETTQTISGLIAGTYDVTVTDAVGCTGTSSAIVSEPALLTADASVVSHVSCNGGSNGEVTVTADGGTPAYSYYWSTAATTQSITGLSAGTYDVTVTDEFVYRYIQRDCFRTCTAYCGCLCGIPCQLQRGIRWRGDSYC